MRGQYYILERQQRIVWWRWLLVEHVEAGAKQLIVCEPSRMLDGRHITTFFRSEASSRCTRADITVVTLPLLDSQSVSASGNSAGKNAGNLAA
jgi:hypothetical protein